MTVIHPHPAADLFPRLEAVELQRLADDIRANGLRIPIVMLDGKVLDGRNRLAACRIAGVEPRFVEHDGSDPWRAVWSLNRERRHITDATRLALIGKQMVCGSDRWAAQQERARAAANKSRSDSERKTKSERNGCPASREATHRNHAAESSRKTSSRLAAEVGVSRSTMERAIELEAKAPEKAEAVRRGDVEGHAALREVKRSDRLARLGEVARGNKALDGDCGLATVLYADPPWRYDDSSTDPTRVIENQYPTMSHDELCAIGEKVRGICTPDAVLYLWSPPPLIRQAIAVMEAWGFEYKTGGVWDKLSIGAGYYFRQQHEHLLVGVRGNVPKPEPGVRESSVYGEKRGAHSAKPVHFYDLLERQYPELPKRELFARSPARPGWLPSWGNQA
jgi:N6-adenosine-specific RNA methylase IME4